MYNLKIHGTTEGSVPFMFERVKKMKNPTIVPLRYYHVCPKNLRKLYESLNEYCVTHELFISENSGFQVELLYN